MTLSTEQIRNIAELARLDLSQTEIGTIHNNLNKVLTLIEQLQAVDASEVEPMSHPQNVPQRLREDLPTEADQRALFQQVAPQVENGLYLVPKVIE